MWDLLVKSFLGRSINFTKQGIRVPRIFDPEKSADWAGHVPRQWQHMIFNHERMTTKRVRDVKLGVSAQYSYFGFSGNASMDLSTLTKTTSIKDDYYISFVRHLGLIEVKPMHIALDYLYEPFLERVAALPKEYDLEVYLDFINDYGTHFTKECTIGGSLSAFDKMSKEMSWRQRRLHAEATAAKLGKISGTQVAIDENEQLTRNVVIDGKGGEWSELRLETLKKEDVKNWISSVAAAPDVIEFVSAPISMVISDDDISRNLDKASVQYYQAFETGVVPKTIQKVVVSADIDGKDGLRLLYPSTAEWSHYHFEKWPNNLNLNITFQDGTAKGINYWNPRDKYLDLLKECNGRLSLSVPKISNTGGGKTELYPGTASNYWETRIVLDDTFRSGRHKFTVAIEWDPQQEITIDSDYKKSLL